MAIPDWLAGLTNARQFANNPANNFQPTMGDALQGIGSSMATHWRRNFANPEAGTGQAGPAVGMPLQTGIPQAAAGLAPGLEAILSGLRGEGPNPYASPAPALTPAPGVIQAGTQGFGGGGGMQTQLPVQGSPAGLATRWGLNNPLRGLGLEY